ncbi:EAL domain-containing protein, partial [Klebsiella oxytoca]
MDYILSPCSLVADGLAKVMTACGMRPVVLPLDATTLPAGANIRRIVVFLPEAPARLLITLQQVASMLELAATPLPMLILSRSPASWLWHTLLHQVIDHHLLSEVSAAASDLPVPSLTTLLQDYTLERYPSLKQLADEEMRIGGRKAGGLTRQELNAILGLLSGDSVNAQAKHRGISHKTLYTQRTAGLKKIVEHHPQLATRFPGNQTKRQKIQPNAALSAFEREFVHAVHCRQIFPVFQPITDGRMQLKGLELLSRWRQNGHVILPGDFLPQLRSEYAWLVLTAFVLREAVQNIN